MKAIVLRGFGGPEVLRLEEVPTPTPAAGEILVKVRSVSVNRTLDLIVRQGNYPVKVQLPHILGVDPAGIVAHVGTDTDKVKVGDRVAVLSFIACRKCRYCLRGEEANCLSSRHIGLHRWGGYAEYVTAPARNAFRWSSRWGRVGTSRRIGVPEPIDGSARSMRLTSRACPSPSAASSTMTSGRAVRARSSTEASVNTRSTEYPCRPSDLTTSERAWF